MNKNISGVIRSYVPHRLKDSYIKDINKYSLEGYYLYTRTTREPVYTQYTKIFLDNKLLIVGLLYWDKHMEKLSYYDIRCAYNIVATKINYKVKTMLLINRVRLMNNPLMTINLVIKNFEIYEYCNEIRELQRSIKKELKNN